MRIGRIRRLLITATITITLAVPAAYLLSPHVQRWQRLDQLDHPDAALRERALSYVIQHAGRDDRVRDGAARRLAQVDSESATLIFRALYHAGQAQSPIVLEAMTARMREVGDEPFRRYARELDEAGAWRHPPVARDIWLRGIALMLEDEDAMARVLAVHRLADLDREPIDESMLTMLERAAADGDANVRYAAILAAAELAAMPVHDEARMELESILALGTHDEAEAIARDAWLLLALLDPLTGFRADWRAARPAVAEAILFAALYTNPMHPQPAREALHDRAAPSRVRAAAAYALHVAREISLPSPGQEDDPLVAWRLALVAPPDVRAMPMDDPTPMHLAMLHHMAGQMVGLESAFKADSPFGPLMQLALLEGIPVDRVRVPIHDGMPDMQRLAAVAVTQQPQAGDLQRLFESTQPQMRDGACIVAVQRFDEAQLAALIEELLWNYSDEARMSGAILSGMTGLQGDLLAQRAEDQTVWSVQQVMHLGLWMQGRMDELEGQAAYMLMRDDLPRSTILLAMLHRQPQAALDYLFNPRGLPPVDLLEWLDHYRWHRVLRHYLPADAPPLWHWADESLKRFQIEVLRNWYLLRRHVLRSHAEREVVP